MFHFSLCIILEMEYLLQPTDSATNLVIQRAHEKFTCKNQERLSVILAESLFYSDYNYRLFTDWTFTYVHPLIFEINVKPNSTETNNYHFFMQYLDLVFLDILRKHLDLNELTLILAMRRNQSNGLRIYLVDLEISHDDYVELCNRMKTDIDQHQDKFPVSLNCPSHFALPASDRDKDTVSLYVPFKLVHAIFDNYQENGILHSHRLESINLEQKKANTFFNRIAHDPATWKSVASAMMPFSKPDATRLHYPTKIVFGNSSTSVAQFQSCINQYPYSIIKKKKLTVATNRYDDPEPFCYNFLKKNATHIKDFESVNSVLKIWYDRFQVQKRPLKDISEQLRALCPHLRNEEDPLAVVLKAHERPVYYALFNTNYAMNDHHFHTLSKDFLPPPKEAQGLTYETIFYLAYEVSEERSRFTLMGYGWDWIFSSINTLSEWKNYVCYFQRKAFPIVKSGEKVYIWDAIIHKWCQVTNLQEEIEYFVQFIIKIMTFFDGYDKIPSEISKKKSQLIQLVTCDILRDVENTKKYVVGHKMPESFEKYGQNVPEYYFFN